MITDIQVISLNNYNKQHPSGSDLSDICEYSIFNRTADTTKFPFLEYYNKRFDNNSGLGDEHQKIWFSFKQKPEKTNTKQRFVIVFSTDKGRQLVDTTQTITLLL